MGDLQVHEKVLLASQFEGKFTLVHLAERALLRLFGRVLVHGELRRTSA